MTNPRYFATCGVIAALIVGLFAACSDNPLDVSTGVNVVVRRGPIAPVEHDSVDNTAPVERAGIILFDAFGNPLAQGFTDSSGEARMVFRAGAYRVQLSSCPGTMIVPDPVTVEVVSGTFTVVNFLCDTGIRGPAGSP